MEAKKMKRIGIRDLVVDGRYVHRNGRWIREIEEIEGDLVYWSDEIGSGHCKKATFLASCKSLAPENSDPELTRNNTTNRNTAESSSRKSIEDAQSRNTVSVPPEISKKSKKKEYFPGLKDLDKASRELPEKRLENHFPGGFSLRDEANAIAAIAIRNGPIEDLHAGKHSKLLANDKLSRITDSEMKEIMIYASERIEALLKKKEDDPEEYYTLLKGYGYFYCSGWKSDPISSD